MVGRNSFVSLKKQTTITMRAKTVNKANLLVGYSFICLMLLLVTGNGVAQDTLVTKQNGRIASKILEIQPQEIVYKRYDNIDGPTYRVNKWEIDKIVYSNGAEEVFNMSAPVAEKRVNAGFIVQQSRKLFLYNNQPLKGQQLYDKLLILNNPQVNLYVEEAQKAKKARRTAGIVVIPMAAIAAGSLGVLCLEALGGGSGEISGAVFMGSAAIGGVFLLRKGHFKHKQRNADVEAVRLYNDVIR